MLRHNGEESENVNYFSITTSVSYGECLNIEGLLAWKNA